MSFSLEPSEEYTTPAIRTPYDFQPENIQLSAHSDILEFQPETDARDNNAKILREDYDAAEEADSKWINWRVWAISGSGLFLDSYNLAAINQLFPSLAFSYWKSNFLIDYGTSMETITLFGAAIGSLVLGYLADKHGRRDVYGWEVLLMLLGTWNLVLSSYNKDPAGKMLVLMATYRFILGVGVGSEYPLSAVITAESTPTKSRARTMTVVFLAQPLGELAAYLTALTTLWVYKWGNAPLQSSDSASTPLMDDVWRDVILIGALPALIVLALRSNCSISTKYAVIESSNENDIDQINILNEKPLSVQNIKKAIFGSRKWILLLFLSASWLLLDLFSREFYAFTKKLHGPNLDGSVYIDWSEHTPKILDHETFEEELLLSALTIFIRVVLPGILMTVMLDFFWPGLYLCIAMLPISLLVLPDWDEQKFLFYLVESTVQILYNLGPNVTTFIISAETCPAQYRTTCYAIITTCGKLGSKTLKIIGNKFDGSSVDISEAYWIGFIYTSMVLPFIILSLITISPAMNKMRKTYLYFCCLSLCVLFGGLLKKFLYPLCEAALEKIFDVWHDPWLMLYPPFWLYHKISLMITSYQLPSYSTVASIFWPKIPEGCERVSWKCGCGIQLYSDFRISSTSQRERLFAFLALSTGLSEDNISGRSSPSITDSNSDSATTESSGSSGLLETTSELSWGNKRPTKRLEKRGGLSVKPGMSISPVPEGQLTKYLALCVNTGRFHTTLGEINVTSICQDNEVFGMIKQRYLEIRGFRARARRLFLVRPTSVQFVKFNVEDSYRADILLKPSIPPKEEVLAGRYEYAPLDLPLPPITTNSFLHYMTNPSCPSLTRTNKWLGCLPKRLCEQLAAQRLAMEPNCNVTGWGIHVEEGLNEVAVAVIALAILLTSGAAGLIYSYIMSDVSGGFGIASWVTGVLGGVLALLHFMWRNE